MLSIFLSYYFYGIDLVRRNIDEYHYLLQIWAMSGFKTGLRESTFTLSICPVYLRCKGQIFSLALNNPITVGRTLFFLFREGLSLVEGDSKH